MLKKENSILEKKGVMVFLFTITLCFFGFFYYFMNQNIEKTLEYKEEHLTEIQSGGTIKKLTKDEYLRKSEEQHYITILSALSANGQTVSISSNLDAKQKLIGTENKFLFQENPIYEKNEIKNFFHSNFEIKKETIDSIIDSTDTKTLFQSGELLPDSFYYNLIESSDSYYIVAMENPNEMEGKKGIGVIKSQIFGRYLNLLQNIEKELKTEGDIKKIKLYQQYFEKIKSNFKFILVYKINKNDINAFDEKTLKQVISNLFIKTSLKQLLDKQYLEVQPVTAETNSTTGSGNLDKLKPKIEKSENIQ